MKAAIDISENNLMLLSTLDLEEVCEAVAAIVMQIGEAKAVALSIWDADTEVFSDHYIYGPRKKDFAKFAEAFAEQADPLKAPKTKTEEVDLEEIDLRLPSELVPVFSYRVEKPEHFYAYLLIAGDDSGSAADLEALLNQYPIGLAVGNCWDVREMRRENERLRSQYEEMEAQNELLEEQTRKLIHDTMAKDSLRTQHVDRERLVYQISNAVRTSLEIQLVLETAVQDIGSTFNLSRCLLLRPVSGSQEPAIHEYHHPTVPSVAELFCTEAGRQFVQVAFSKTAPYDFDDSDSAVQDMFNKDFLRSMGLLSGLLVPLILRDRNIGTIFLQDCVTPRQWSIDNTALFGSLADQLSVAIENADLHEEKKMQAVTDGLTGIANRRHFNDTFLKEFERAKRYGEPLSLIIVDLDFLKKINDTYGHTTGDAAIKSIGKVLSLSCRSVDLPARYGGEEFCLLLPNTDLEEAQNIAERLRKLIEEEPVEGPGTITASVGVATFPLHASDTDTLFHAADEALYAAKDSGRNKVCVSNHLPQ